MLKYDLENYFFTSSSSFGRDIIDNMFEIDFGIVSVKMFRIDEFLFFFDFGFSVFFWSSTFNEFHLLMDPYVLVL